MIVPISRRRLLQRLASPAVRFVYVVAQPGAGLRRLAREFCAGRPAGSICFVPDVDRLAGAELSDFLRLAERPDAPNVLVATATDPTFPQPFANAGPNELCILTDEDFALTPGEIVEFFSLNGVRVDSDAALSVYEMTGGWIAGVSYVLGLWKSEGESVACDPAARPYHALRNYIFEHVLSRLSPDELAALVTTIATADAEPGVLQRALPSANVEVALAALIQRRLLLRSAGGVCVPRLVRESICQHYRGDLGALSLQIAGDLARSGDYAAAARVALSAGESAQAVEYLLQVPLEQVLARRLQFQNLVAKLSDAVVCAHPKLWFAAILSRRYRVDLCVLIAEGEMLLESCDERAEPGLTRLIEACLLMGFYEAGEFERARRIEEELAAQAPPAAESGIVEAMVAASASSALSLVGRTGEAVRYLQAASMLLARAPAVLGLFMQTYVRKSRAEGNWFAEKAFLERAIAAASGGGDTLALATILLDASYGALLAGDDEAMEGFISALRDLGADRELAPFAAFARIGREPQGSGFVRFGLPRMRGITHLFHAAAAGSAHEARAHLVAAMQEFDASGDLFGRIAARAGLAQVVPQRQGELLAQAKTLADGIETLRLRGALSHLAIGELPAHDQPLRRFAEKMRRLREPVTEPLRICAASGAIERGTRALPVSQKVFLLLVALAVRRRPLDREELCEMLWPDEEPQAAANALKMTVRRARLQCGDSNVVRWASNRYSLGDHVRLELEELRSLCEAALKKPDEFASSRPDLHAAYRALAAGRPTHLLEHEWFVGTEATLVRLQIELGQALARDVLKRGDFAHAPELARAMLECDPCDEAAWELIVRAHLATGEREAAVRALRDYRRLTEEHLQSPPSPHIERLLA